MECILVHSQDIELLLFYIAYYFPAVLACLLLY